ncbi:MAG: serine hydrolase [Candidatus Rokuibacteriota bacterium]|nr:MAG: serine hydrolase [Candidatus Rokubacteria bacterium]
MRPLGTLVTLAVLLLTALPVQGASLPTAKPEEVGLSSAALARIGQTLRADVEAGRIPGAVVVVARRGRIAYSETVGFRDKASGAPMKPDTIFRIASMTKPMVSVAAMMLHEEGRLMLGDPVAKYIPAIGEMRVAVLDAGGQTLESTVPLTRPMTVQDLLRHTSGLTYGNRGTTAAHKLYPESSSRASREITSAEFIDRLAKAPLLFQPGTKWEYSLSTDVLGRVVEVASGKGLGQFLDERIFRPLKMADTGFVVPVAKRERLAQALATDPDTGKTQELIDVTVPPKFECGGGCAVSTAGDYVRFGQMLLNRGSLDGARLLGRKTVEYMTSDHLAPGVTGFSNYLPGAGYGFGLGFAVRRDAGVADSNGSAGDYNWGGAFGTYFWVDPKEQLVVVSMTQAPGPIRVHYRHLFRALVYQSIND